MDAQKAVSLQKISQASNKYNDLRSNQITLITILIKCRYDNLIENWEHRRGNPC